MYTFFLENKNGGNEKTANTWKCIGDFLIN